MVQSVALFELEVYSTFKLENISIQPFLIKVALTVLLLFIYKTSLVYVLVTRD